IRFRGQDIEKPFVDIIATSLAPDSAGVAALGEVLPHFSDFAPLCLRVNLPDPDQALRALAASDAVHATPDLLIVARPVAEMLELPLDDRYDDVTIAPCDPAFAAERVAAIYEELTPSRPKLAQWATPADADSLEDAAEQGLLFDVRVDAASAGIVAAERDDSYGLAGFCMQEVAIDHAHRGQRVGVAALQRLARELPSNADDVLWGHIHPDNVPSLRNAQESGRKVVTAHVWVTPAGYGGMPS
ncbi:GNAT family N-acetyltransferase, partial [Microbacterium gubbeenense]|uniref:GNAT family N-acetyltransferase n=3 Tax=Microbacterium gubbeenense TaxID=159896 RepID=UPI003F9BDB16